MKTQLARGQTPFPPPEMRTCHDIRKWRGCQCGNISHARNMIERDGEFWHGRCFARKFGVDALLALPKSQTDKLTLGDVGADLMGKLLDRLARKPMGTCRMAGCHAKATHVTEDDGPYCKDCFDDYVGTSD